MGAMQTEQQQLRLSNSEPGAEANKKQVWNDEELEKQHLFELFKTLRHMPANMLNTTVTSLFSSTSAFASALESLSASPPRDERFLFLAELTERETRGKIGSHAQLRHLPFDVAMLYNVAGVTAQAQKQLLRNLRRQFRNDLMGVSQDYSNGDMFATPVATLLGLQPTRGQQVHAADSFSVTTPLFETVQIKRPNGNVFTVKVTGLSERSNYIQSATLDSALQEPYHISATDLNTKKTLSVVVGPYPKQFTQT
jgi:hypothetical protein